MDPKTSSMLFQLLRLAICGEPIPGNEKATFSPELLPEVFRLAHHHDLAHLLGVGLQNAGLPDTGDALQKQQLTAVYRYERLQYESDRLCAALEVAEIPFVPIKGAVLRRFYPEPWMRTSSDIDVLVRAENLDQAVAHLVQKCGYTEQSRGSHDVALHAKNGQRVELHYDLIEESCAKAASAVLNGVWDMVHVQAGYTYRFAMPDELFYFYHVAHMAKHFENGGCGIRPFLDLWLLNRAETADTAKRDALLAKGDLLRFARSAEKLSRVWFDGEEQDARTERMQAYILLGGVYGNDTNRIAVQQQKQGGRLRYALSKIFLPYDAIKFHYPILQKYRWLTPFMEVRRWCKLVFCGHAKRTLWELQYNQNIRRDEADRTKQFLKELGL